MIHHFKCSDFVNMIPETFYLGVKLQGKFLKAFWSLRIEGFVGSKMQRSAN